MSYLSTGNKTPLSQMFLCKDAAFQTVLDTVLDRQTKKNCGIVVFKHYFMLFKFYTWVVITVYYL